LGREEKKEPIQPLCRRGRGGRAVIACGESVTWPSSGKKRGSAGSGGREEKRTKKAALSGRRKEGKREFVGN